MSSLPLHHPCTRNFIRITTSKLTLTVSAYPYDVTLYTCATSITWLNNNSIPPTQFAAGSGTLELIKTVNMADAVLQHTATIVITNQESGRVLCREPIRRGHDFSFLQNKLPPTKKELRCVSFELATGAPMFIMVRSLWGRSAGDMTY